MNNLSGLLDKYKGIIGKLNIRIFSLYEIEVLLFSKNINFNIVKIDKNTIYITSNNINILYNVLMSYGFYKVMLFSKEKNISILASSFTTDILQKRSKFFRLIISDMFNRDLDIINKQLNNQKKNIKKMSDEEMSLYKKEVECVVKIKREFVNIVKRLCV